jgi:uncharacterized protein
MTPTERQLVSDLFDRLATLEDAPRDPEAERAIRDGLAQAPNALYALVQTALLQDEVLKNAQARIQALEAERGASAQPPRQGGFLDSARGSIWGRGNVAHGSVPQVRSADTPMGAPSGFGNPSMAGPPMGGPAMGGPANAMQPQPAPPSRAGAFLGTAAAAAVGVIGGSLLLDGIRSMTGGSGGGRPGGQAMADPAAAGERGGGLPWSGGGGDLARDAGVDHIGRSSGSDPLGQSRGLFSDAGDRQSNAADPFAQAQIDDGPIDSSDFGGDGGFDSGGGGDE